MIHSFISSTTLPTHSINSINVIIDNSILYHRIIALQWRKTSASQCIWQLSLSTIQRSNQANTHSYAHLLHVNAYSWKIEIHFNKTAYYAYWSILGRTYVRTYLISYLSAHFYLFLWPRRVVSGDSAGSFCSDGWLGNAVFSVAFPPLHQSPLYISLH